MKAVLLVDDAVGELRRALVDGQGRAFQLELERWSERGKRARLDQVWWGRARARMGDRGWFVDLGMGPEGVLETKAAVTEGALLSVRVKSEAWGGKGPVLSLENLPASVRRPDKPGLHAEPSEDPFLAGAEIIETRTGADSRRGIDAALETAVARRVGIEGGGELVVEATEALTAVDVDAGGRGGSDVALNMAAAVEVARQVALRGLGGLVVVDFVTMAVRADREAVAEQLRVRLGELLGRASKVLEISPLGLCEMSVARRARPVADAVGAGSVEREALDALRGLESEGWTARGARLRARVSRAAARWLEEDHIGWREALAARIGARWELEVQ